MTGAGSRPTHLVIGAGEVGHALGQVISGTGYRVVLRDLEAVSQTADVMHVCYPYSPDFEQDTRDYQTHHQADLVIVHSTVPVGTCDRNGWVHSPVRGQHPHLIAGLETFAKHFGGRRADEAIHSLRGAFSCTMAHRSAADTEAGKLWELAQYGIQIRVEKAIHEWCEQHGLDFDVVYSDMAQTYNEGYEALGHSEFHRPVLRHMPGEIGGHCVRENAQYLDHEIARIVEKGF